MGRWRVVSEGDVTVGWIGGGYVCQCMCVGSRRTRSHCSRDPIGRDDPKCIQVSCMGRTELFETHIVRQIDLEIK